MVIYDYVHARQRAHPPPPPRNTTQRSTTQQGDTIREKKNTNKNSKPNQNKTQPGSSQKKKRKSNVCLAPKKPWKMGKNGRNEKTRPGLITRERHYSVILAPGPCEAAGKRNADRSSPAPRSQLGQYCRRPSCRSGSLACRCSPLPAKFGGYNNCLLYTSPSPRD